MNHHRNYSNRSVDFNSDDENRAPQPQDEELLGEPVAAGRETYEFGLPAPWALPNTTARYDSLQTNLKAYTEIIEGTRETATNSPATSQSSILGTQSQQPWQPFTSTASASYMMRSAPRPTSQPAWSDNGSRAGMDQYYRAETESQVSHQSTSYGFSTDQHSSVTGSVPQTPSIDGSAGPWRHPPSYSISPRSDGYSDIGNSFYGSGDTGTINPRNLEHSFSDFGQDDSPQLSPTARRPSAHRHHHPHTPRPQNTGHPYQYRSPNSALTSRNNVPQLLSPNDIRSAPPLSRGSSQSSQNGTARNQRNRDQRGTRAQRHAVHRRAQSSIAVSELAPSLEFRPAPTRIRSDALPRTRPNTGGERFPCEFAFAGCQSSFASKNEWKRHVETQHMMRHLWKCKLGTCNRPGSHPANFNRKDLAKQHIERKHRELLDRLTDEQQKREKARLLNEMHVVVRRGPEEVRCGVPNCERVFKNEGNNDGWDTRMEHVGKHYEDGYGPPPSALDNGLTQWALQHNLIYMAQGRYFLHTQGKAQAQQHRNL